MGGRVFRKEKSSQRPDAACRVALRRPRLAQKLPHFNFAEQATSQLGCNIVSIVERSRRAEDYYRAPPA